MNQIIISKLGNKVIVNKSWFTVYNSDPRPQIHFQFHEINYTYIDEGYNLYNFLVYTSSESNGPWVCDEVK